jgi:hypothetical protein
VFSPLGMFLWVDVFRIELVCINSLDANYHINFPLFKVLKKKLFKKNMVCLMQFETF